MFDFASQLRLSSGGFLEDAGSPKLKQYWSTAYFPALDGLRAFCVAMVIFNHAHVSYPRYMPTWEGVDIFFVLSGYLISTLLLREREAYGNVTLKGFYIRRTFRILPVYFAVLLMYVGVLLGTHDSRRWADFKHALPYLISFTQEFRPARFGTVFGHAWSLGYEEKFYLVWPLLLLALFPLRGKKLWTLVLIGGAMLLLPAQASRSYGGLFIGSVLAILLDKQSPNPLQGVLSKLPVTLALVALAGAFWILTHDTRYVLLFSACAALLTASLVLNRSWLSRFLSHPILVLFGKRSYAMYLVHVLCLNVFERIATSIHFERWYFIVPGTYLASFVVATGLFYLVERPCIDRGRRLSKAMRAELTARSHAVVEAGAQDIPVIEREEEGTPRAY